MVTYQTWAHDAARKLTDQISSEDIERLVLTPRYWLLQTADTEARRLLLSIELAERVDALDDAISALDAQIQRWSTPEVFAVADTSFYIQSADTLDKVNYAQVLTAGFAPVRLLIPIIVIDELDGLKKSKDPRVRSQARRCLAIIDRLFAYATDLPMTLRPPHDMGGRVTLELVFDPPGHVRADIADDEIVDRATVIQALAGGALAGGKLKFVTFDTSQSFRARHAGLETVKLRDPE
ncbi:PIN domain-containing protein [Micromonospora aurantiaca]|uniref:PIN domain-containing protein n=1 Tax=Micromonospora aurantiaca (nom. illeg.) TaxID=47850 RepID=UPI003416C2DB